MVSFFDRNSNVLYLSYWINLILLTLSSGWVAILDFVGVNPPPSAAPVSYTSGGLWEGPYPTPIIGAGVANVPDGRLLLWSAYARSVFSQPDVMDKQRTRTALLDPTSPHTSSTEALVSETDHDMFCPGTVLLPDRSIMITGGSTTERTTLYHLDTHTWTKGPDMRIPRGYHSMTLLGGNWNGVRHEMKSHIAYLVLYTDGSVFSFGGSWSGGVGGKDGEVWSPSSDSWSVRNHIQARGSLITVDKTGVEKGEYVTFATSAGRSKPLPHLLTPVSCFSHQQSFLLCSATIRIYSMTVITCGSLPRLILTAFFMRGLRE